MTNDYRIILPLMFAVAVSLMVSQRIQHESIYLFGLKRHGITLGHGRDIEVLQNIMVAETLEKKIRPLKSSTLIVKAADTLVRSRSHGSAVVNENNELVGFLTLQDIDRAYAEGKTASTRRGDLHPGCASGLSR